MGRTEEGGGVTGVDTEYGPAEEIGDNVDHRFRF